MTEQPESEATAPGGPQCVRVTRRQFVLDTALAAVLVAPVAAVVVSIARYLMPPQQTIAGRRERLEVATVAELAADQGKDFVYSDTPYVLIRVGDEFRAFSKVCTHLGCIVEWRPGNRTFWCPCHAGVFDANGGVVSGPPPAPLPKLRVEVADGKVYVEG